jgi:hypothetical protein
MNKLCENILQGRRNTTRKTLVFYADLSREKLDRSQVWSHHKKWIATLEELIYLKVKMKEKFL